MELAIAIGVASVAAWDIGRRWMATRAQDVTGALEDNLVRVKNLTQMQDDMDTCLEKNAAQTAANLDSIEALTTVIKRMQSDHGAMTAMGQTQLQKRMGMNR